VSTLVHPREDVLKRHTYIKMSSQSSQSSQSSAYTVYSLLHSKECPSDIAEILEIMYNGAEYPGYLVVRNIVDYMHLDQESFVHALQESVQGSVQNVEWYLEHIAITLDNYIKNRTVVSVTRWM
jgi:hypothetical protein